MSATTTANDTSTTTATPEIIAGRTVHPAATVFPLLEGAEFDSLVESIRRSGMQTPIVLRGDVLLDGRNRLRAVELLRAEGLRIACPEIQRPADGTIGDTAWIEATNLDRRHLTDDARVLAAAMLHDMLEAESKAAQAASRFDSATGKAAAGKGAAAVTLDSTSPSKRDRRRSEKRTTAGKLATKSRTTSHKARQAIAAARGVKNGTVAKQDVAAVMAGTKPLRDVAPKASGKPKADKPTATDKPTTGKPADDAELEIRTKAAKAWQRLKDGIPVTEHPLLRKVLAGIIRDDGKAASK
jgi:ParB-like chromosome segregation protein Spo0J